MIRGVKNTRVAGILLEAGTPLAYSKSPEPLLLWGQYNTKRQNLADSPIDSPTNIISDVFARVGAFSYSTPFKSSCLVSAEYSIHLLTSLPLQGDSVGSNDAA